MATRRSAQKADSNSKTEPEGVTSSAPSPEAPAPSPRPKRRRQRAEQLTVRAPAVARVKSGAKVPTAKTRPEPPFWLVFGGAWTVCGDHVIPHFVRMSAEPGANNVGMRVDRATGRRLPMVEAAKAQIRERGEVLLEWDVLGEGTSYIQQDPRTGGWYDIWSSVFAGSDRVQEDSEAKARWYHALVDRGILPLPAIHELGALLDNLEDLHVQRDKDDHNKRELARQMEVVRRELAEALAEADEAPVEAGKVEPTDPSSLLGD